MFLDRTRRLAKTASGVMKSRSLKGVLWRWLISLPVPQHSWVGGMCSQQAKVSYNQCSLAFDDTCHSCAAVQNENHLKEIHRSRANPLGFPELEPGDCLLSNPLGHSLPLFLLPPAFPQVFIQRLLVILHCPWSLQCGLALLPSPSSTLTCENISLLTVLAVLLRYAQ